MAKLKVDLCLDEKPKEAIKKATKAAERMRAAAADLKTVAEKACKSIEAFEQATCDMRIKFVNKR